jgi:hypothetical protein
MGIIMLAIYPSDYPFLVVWVAQPIIPIIMHAPLFFSKFPVKKLVLD